MRCGVPVIYGNNSSLREIVGDSGLPVDLEDMAALAAQMHRLLKDPSLASDLGRRGRERASAFTWAKAAAETASLYSQLLG
jgi:glycosyltransferase involved in cell wall biosynthesis